MIDFNPTASTAPGLPARTLRRRLNGAALVVVAGLIAAGLVVNLPLWRVQSSDAAVTAAPATIRAPGVPVSVAVVAERAMPVWTDFSGRLEAVNRVDVRPRAAGTLVQAHFHEGALVKQGDLLFTIDRAPYAAEVKRGEAQVAAAGARLLLAAKEQQRGLRLVGSGAMPQRDVDQRVNEFHAAEANLRDVRAALDVTNLNLGYTEVRAPIAGRVGKIEVTAGNLVAAGPSGPVLTTLVSVDPIYASFDADERSVGEALASLPRGGDLGDTIGRIPVQLGTLTDEGTPLLGRLQLVDNLVDAHSGTVRVRAVFDNADGRLTPGQFARLRLGQAVTQPTIAIDERAVGTDQDRRFVMVVGADNKIVYRKVQLGGLAGGLRVVTAGLQSGEQVVVEGLQRVRPGVLVAPQVVAMTPVADIAVGSR